MLYSNIPVKMNIPFANAAGGSFIRSIPQASQIGITAGAASLTDGFPPVCFLPIGSGGTPPWGQDFNGLLFQMSSWNRWQMAGGTVKYDSTFQTAIGGYPQGAIVQSATTANTFWLSTADANTTNPDTGGAGWIQFAALLGYANRVTTLLGTTSTTTPAFTVPTANQTNGTTTLVVALQAAGGGGGNSSDGSSGTVAGNPGGGGGAGEFNYKVVTSLTPGASITVTLGANGKHVSASNATAAVNSSFGSLLGCVGGGGAFWGANGTTGGVGGGTAGTGGTPTGDLNIPGSNGGPAGNGTNSVTISDVYRNYALGGFSARGYPNINQTGTAGIGYGSGGTGASGGSNLAGGDGGLALCQIWY